jgi:hypothetical protein
MTETARKPSLREVDAVNAVTLAVDRTGRQMDERWGVGRLPTLVPPEWAAKFAMQRRKFSEAIQAWSYPEALKHGEAMQRAYAKLDELALAGGREPIPAEQWEVETAIGVFVLVREVAHSNQDRLKGRKGQVWSMEEIANMLIAYPEIVAVKNVFPGAELVETRPDRRRVLDAELNDDIPF